MRLFKVLYTHHSVAFRFKVRRHLGDVSLSAAVYLFMFIHLEATFEKEMLELHKTKVSLKAVSPIQYASF